MKCKSYKRIHVAHCSLFREIPLFSKYLQKCSQYLFRKDELFY